MIARWTKLIRRLQMNFMTRQKIKSGRTSHLLPSQTVKIQIPTTLTSTHRSRDRSDRSKCQNRCAITARATPPAKGLVIDNVYVPMTQPVAKGSGVPPDLGIPPSIREEDEIYAASHKREN